MDCVLKHVEDDNLTDSERPMFNVLKATLQYPANSVVKGTKLTNDINFFCSSQEDGVNVDATLWEIWRLILDIASCIPHSHAWHDSLVQSLQSLRRQAGAIPKHDELLSTQWKSLPKLSYCMREQWLDPTGDDDEPSQEFEKWKNLNSFAARLTSPDYAPWLNLPIWQLRTALEEPPARAIAMQCRLWVAGEWIIHCADLIFEHMNSKERLDKDTARALSIGSLGVDIGLSPLSMARWEYWKKRFSELAADAASFGLDSASTERITHVLKSMNAVEA